MNWNSWPFNTQGDIVVPIADDQTLLSAAHAVGNTFLLGVSPLQFKHYSGANYYRASSEKKLHCKLPLKSIPAERRAKLGISLRASSLPTARFR